MSNPDAYIPNEALGTANTGLHTIADPFSELKALLEDIVTNYPPTKELSQDHFRGIYIGPTGIAYLFFHVSKQHPDLVVGGHTPEDWTGQYLSALPRPEGKVAPGNCGILNEPLGFAAVSAIYSGDLAHVEKLVSYLPDALATDDEGEWRGASDWASGLAGYLYFLRMVKHFLPSATALVDPALARLIASIMSHGPDWVAWFPGSEMGQGYTTRRWVGAGHGDLGILTQVLLSDPSQARPLEDKVRGLLALQHESGTWPYDYEPGSKLLVQFCHGSVGFINSLRAIRERYAYTPDLQAAMDQAIERARANVWREGLLRKEPNLCHGITGNAFSFAASDSRRSHFLAYGSAKMMAEAEEEKRWTKADHGYSYSLGLGSVPGRAWGFLVMNRDNAEHITYNDV